MGISIGQAQAGYLKTGRLNKLGTKKGPDEFTLDATTEALVKVAGGLVISAQDNLEAGAHVSSGELNKSIKALDPEVSGKTVKVDIQALNYYAYINKGVRGTKSGSGLFAFKSSYPSLAMVQSISDWIGRGHFANRNVKQTVGKLEAKNATLAKLSSSYAVARSIKMHGIKPTSFFDKAVDSGKQAAKDELGKALKIDTINSLPNSL
jgi:hypothetical protein